jgi:hypothetical protein
VLKRYWILFQKAACRRYHLFGGCVSRGREIQNSTSYGRIFHPGICDG